MDSNRLYLVIGLGNPGNAYHVTRHNAGFMVIDELSDRFSIPVNREKFGACLGRGVIENTRVVLAKPMKFMNRSGPPARQVADYFRISGRDLVIIHDDIDLASGRIKIKEKGGHGGHRGIKSLIEGFGGGDFVRLRIGVGRPGPRIGAADHVLGKFNPEESGMLPEMIERARDAVVSILCKGARESMNVFNQKTS